MPISITITGDTVQEVRADLARFLGADQASEQVAPEKSAASAKTATAPKAETASASKGASPSEEPKTAETTTVAQGTEGKINTVKQLAQKFVASNGRDAFVEVLQSVGAENISGIPADQLDTVIEKLS